MVILNVVKVICFDTLLQVLILKIVKVICFDTLLQVLILKIVKVAVSVELGRERRKG